MHVSSLKRLTVAVLLAGCASTALAQYVWLNEQGVKQYSDAPPPASVPNSKILKSPRGSAQQTSAPAKAVDEATTEGSATKKGPETIAEKNADYSKRKSEQAEKDKEAEQKAVAVANKKKNCDSAATYKRVLDSGERISSMDKSGEKYYLSDEQRAQATKDANRVLDGCK